MRLLHTQQLIFKEFYDADVPSYAILSHQWGEPENECSYEHFIAIKDVRFSGRELAFNRPGLDKILHFCDLATLHGYDWCWIDTCCIDKRNSAELTEAINAMYSWYCKAEICYAYLRDVDNLSDLETSRWFGRGWTLQELLAPPVMIFYSRQWQPLGTRAEFKVQISNVTGIDEALLDRSIALKAYSVAQKMSWAALRQTSRVEDQAYCLLGLFGVNMPLLYGEGTKAFRRLQENILQKGGDNSIFAWGSGPISGQHIVGYSSMLAMAPSDFKGCGNIRNGFNTHRILFEVSSRGMMILVHRSYDRETLNTLLNCALGVSNKGVRGHLGLTIPLGCYQPRLSSRGQVLESFFVHIVEDYGKWYRVAVSKHYETYSQVTYMGPHYLAYANDYIRLYVHHDWDLTWERQVSEPHWLFSTDVKDVQYLHLRDTFDAGVDHQAKHYMDNSRNSSEARYPWALNSDCVIVHGLGS